MAQLLLIEPDLILGKTYGEALIRAGHEVVWCITAHQGILAADDTKPDIVILEPQLAEHGGMEFLFEFRSYPEWDGIPVLIFSRLPVEELALNHKAMDDLGIRGYWQKSRLTLASFVRAVDGALAMV